MCFSLFCLSFAAFAAFVAFPESSDSIFAHSKPENILIETSGNTGIFHNDENKCYPSDGTETIQSNRKTDWCSNVLNTTDDKEKKLFIQYSLKNKKMSILKYSIRNGCFYYGKNCCNYNENANKSIYLTCSLYSFTLQASNDKKVWTKVHNVVKDDNFRGCEVKTYQLNKQTEAYRFFRLVLDKEYPKSSKCLRINQIEFYGNTIDDLEQENRFDYDEDDENSDGDTISIIGRLKR